MSAKAEGLPRVTGAFLAVPNDFMLSSLYSTTGDAGVLIAYVRMNTRRRRAHYGSGDAHPLPAIVPHLNRTAE